jgi:hypothetical protein
MGNGAAEQQGREWRRPHGFFWLVLPGLTVAVVAASLAEDNTPVWALRSGWIYRTEVGLALAAAVYVILLAGWLAWHGQAFRRIQLPGGPGVEIPPLDQTAKGVDKIAGDFDKYRTKNDEAVERLGTAVERLNDRVDELERR